MDILFVRVTYCGICCYSWYVWLHTLSRSFNTRSVSTRRTNTQWSRSCISYSYSEVSELWEWLEYSNCSDIWLVGTFYLTLIKPCCLFDCLIGWLFDWLNDWMTDWMTDLHSNRLVILTSVLPAIDISAIFCFSTSFSCWRNTSSHSFVKINHFCKLTISCTCTWHAVWNL